MNDFLLWLQSQGIRHEAEHKFHETRKWRIDIALIDYKIAIEIEGGVWAGGRHVHPTGFIKDMEKYNELSASGWRLLRTQPKKIMGLVPLIDRMIK